jgi:hypothetical protein
VKGVKKKNITLTVVNINNERRKYKRICVTVNYRALGMRI